jgi:aspartate aminotransferase
LTCGKIGNVALSRLLIGGNLIGGWAHSRDLMYAGITAIPGVTCSKPHGAFYLFPNISATGLDSAIFCERLLAQEHVALVPGVAFGADANVRLSYATDLETIEKGVMRLARFVQSL